MSKPPDIIYINTKWDHFDILASSKSDYHCKIKENLFIQELYKPAFYVNVSCQKADALLISCILIKSKFVSWDETENSVVIFPVIAQ